MAGEYAGDINPGEAMALLRKDRSAVLVDVRTAPEWSGVGVPNLASIDAEPVFLQWQTSPTMAINLDFVSDLKAELRRRNTPSDAPILFLCRSGARSKAAARALSAEGMTRCLNVAGGFEGGPDAQDPSVRIEGWKARDLPWSQS